MISLSWYKYTIKRGYKARPKLRQYLPNRNEWHKKEEATNPLSSFVFELFQWFNSDLFAFRLRITWNSAERFSAAHEKSFRRSNQSHKLLKQARAIHAVILFAVRFRLSDNVSVVQSCFSVITVDTKNKYLSMSSMCYFDRKHKKRRKRSVAETQFRRNTCDTESFSFLLACTATLWMSHSWVRAARRPYIKSDYVMVFQFSFCSHTLCVYKNNIVYHFVFSRSVRYPFV